MHDLAKPDALRGRSRLEAIGVGRIRIVEGAVAALSLAALFAASGDAAERCKVKVARKTGQIEVSASGVDAATLRWGPAAGAESVPFFAASCVAGGKAKRCLLGDPAGLGARTPPEGCTVYVADALGSCSAWIPGCTPGLRPGTAVAQVIRIPAEAINPGPTLVRHVLGYVWPAGSGANGSVTLPMPHDWDGASDFSISILFSPLTNAAGVVDFFLRVAGRSVGEPLFDPGSLASVAGVTNIGSDALHRQEFVVPAALLDPADDVLHVFAIQRGGGAETYPDTVIVRAIEISYTGVR